MHQFVTNYPNYSNIPNGGDNCSSPFVILPLKAEEVESERFFIGFYKILINRIFSRIKVSLLHSILVLLLLHLLA